jgi:hypothetical protein
MVGIRKFNWLPQPSAWQQAETWRARRSALSADALSAGDVFTSSFAQANGDQIKGLAKLAGDAALKRINAAAKAKFDAIANTKVAGIDDAKANTAVDKKA